MAGFVLFDGISVSNTAGVVVTLVVDLRYYLAAQAKTRKIAA